MFVCRAGWTFSVLYCVKAGENERKYEFEYLIMWYISPSNLTDKKLSSKRGKNVDSKGPSLIYIINSVIAEIIKFLICQFDFV